ncbi:hypothetical protein P280DRAFT_540477 [Massarina eburnea CBS 473.64]|uniref:Transcription factor domain-containing protein n=1 Tax=Massarina eburnea CBS 473.64 TaxID=1395130 RepID=A0A6A6S3Y8_9PLEO|nr:hypothetical protein P280DRAFT_540477 [Massarina eburnea CBS 473.64]
MESRGTPSIANSAAARKRPASRIRACWECKTPTKPQPSISTNLFSTYGLDNFKPDGVDSACALHIGQRLSKLEQLFEKFVCRKTPNSGTPSDETRSQTSTLVNEKSSGFVGLPHIPSDAPSIQSTGDSLLTGQAWTSAPSIRAHVNKPEVEQAVDTVRQTLTNLLPSQHDANVIFESTNGWMALGHMYRPSKHLFVSEDPETYALDMSAVSQERTIIVARTLLHLAVCISSLPPEFDTSRLQHIWNLDVTMENYVGTVTSLVTSSDEPLLTLPGLETLCLLALYQMHIANLRQSWLIIRRAMSLAHLMGFHRIVEQRPLAPPVEAIDSAARMWRGLVDKERLLGLLLRLPFAADDYPIDENGRPHEVHRAHLAALCRQVSELDREVTPQTYVQALALDEKLESLMRERAKDFWEVPNVPPTARTPESYDVLERLVVQMWHFELKIFIHLPYLLRAAKDNRYEYSKVTALQASRNIMMRWFALRNAGITQACARFGEMGVFIAAVTLTLDILIDMATKPKQDVQKSKCNDFVMICRIISELDKLGKASTRERIAARTAVVLKNILSTLDPSKSTVGKTRMTIPYFGTIEMEYKKIPTRPAFDLDSDTAKILNSTGTGQHPPVFSFFSNALWPPSTENDGCDSYDLDFDMILFDGLQDMNVEGSWVF